MAEPVVVGLEVHVELRTERKLFCHCENRFGAEANSLVCPICLGEPGTLPHLNEEAVTLAISAGLALGCRIAPVSRFDRKNYAYHDLPKGYQITQFFEPLCQGGKVRVGEREIRLRRIHLEEDAAKTIYLDEGRYTVDYNRCGVPLIEIVTEPDFRCADEVRIFLDELRLTLSHLNISDCRMEEGSLRCDVNVSVGENGVPVELKNIGSVRAICRAIDYEAKRQNDRLAQGLPVLRQTRRWDERRQVSEEWRDKERLCDYRYLPEPDLLPLFVDNCRLEGVRSTLPELPAERRLRLREVFGLKAETAARLTEQKPLAEYFEEVAAVCGEPQETANWLLGDFAALYDRAMAPSATLSAAALGTIITMVVRRELSRPAGRELLAALIGTDEDPRLYARRHSLLLTDDEKKIASTVETVLAEQADAVREYRDGKTRVFEFLVGQALARLRGSADPVAVREALRQKLGK